MEALNDWQRKRRLRKLDEGKIRRLQVELHEANKALGDVDKLLEESPDRLVDQYSEKVWPIENELRWQQQRKLTARARSYGIEMPEELWEPRGNGHPVLSYRGEAWVRREVSKHRRDVARDWAAIISPIASSIIAILGLLVALSKQQPPK